MRTSLGSASRALMVMLVGLALLAPPGRSEPSVDALVSLLVRSRGEKVRMQACLLLGKRKDRRAVPTLVRALYDERRSVRVAAAQALGRIGDPSAISGLRAAAGHADAASANLMRRVAAELVQKTAAQRPTERPSLYLGPLSDRTTAWAGAREHFRSRLQPALTRASGLTILQAAGQRSGGGYYVDGTVERMMTSNRGHYATVRCDVKVLVASWPEKSILMWTDGGASVETGRTEAAIRAAMQDCIDAAAQTVADNVAQFVRSRL